MTQPKDVIIEDLLQAKFEPGEHKSYTKEWTNKRGEHKSAGPFTYVEDETVMDRLDFVLGFGHWGVAADPAGDNVVRVTLRVQDPRSGQWTEYQDFGYATNADSPEPLKEAWTDGFRRVARLTGVARYVYAGEGPAPQSQGQQGQHGGGVAPLAPTGAVPSVPQAVPPQPAGAQPADEAAAQHNPPTCPNHGYPWTDGKYGPYCKSRARDGEAANQRGYCNLKPQS